MNVFSLDMTDMMHPEEGKCILNSVTLYVKLTSVDYWFILTIF